MPSRSPPYSCRGAVPAGTTGSSQAAGWAQAGTGRPSAPAERAKRSGKTW